MADQSENKFNPRETAWYRGLKENNSWLKRRWFVWVLAVVLAGGGLAAYEIYYAGQPASTAAVYGLIAAAAGAAVFFLLSLWWHLASGLRQQRDEARQGFIETSAHLREKTGTLKACTGQLVDLEVKHKSLVGTYQPELGGIKSGDTVKGKKFNVSLLFNQMHTNVIANVTFENCTFAGPAVVLLLGTETEVTGPSFSGNLDNVVVKADTGKGYLGMCALLNSKIRNCKFENVGILGDEELKAKLKSGGIKPLPPGD